MLVVFFDSLAGALYCTEGTIFYKAKLCMHHEQQTGLEDNDEILIKRGEEISIFDIKIQIPVSQ